MPDADAERKRFSIIFLQLEDLQPDEFLINSHHTPLPPAKIVLALLQKIQNGQELVMSDKTWTLTVSL